MLGKEAQPFIKIFLTHISHGRACLGGSGAQLGLIEAMIFFCLSNEDLSIIENLGTLGVPVPRRLKRLVVELGEEDRDGW
jgi:phage-related holin